MKHSIYINKEVEDLAKEKGIDINSESINKALGLYLNATIFDCSELRSKKEYGLVTIRVHKIVITLLSQLKRNFRSCKVVSEFVMGLVLRECQTQNCRRYFPDRLYINLTTINSWIEKLKDKLRKL